MLTKITETTYSGTNNSNVSTYSVGNDAPVVPSTSINTLAQTLLGDNYREVDLTANGLLNVGDDDLGVPNMNTYSINSSSSTKTLYSFQSDEIGNITNIGNVTVDWNGRRLESISQNGTVVVSYDYNIDGQRTKKIALDTETGEYITTEFFYNGEILAGQKKGNDTIIFMYDNNGDIFGFTYNGTPYYYVKNAQNDVTLILDENGQAVVIYLYDAWGIVNGCLDASDFGLAAINPIMYRSYYVDLEMGMFMYYLNSRYYMADWGRFVSADSMVKTPGAGNLSANMFAYCENNPTNNSDSTGQWAGIDDLIAGFVGGIVGVASQLVSDVVTSAINGSWQPSSWETYAGAFVGGVVGGVASLYVGPIASAAIGAGSATLIGQTLEKITGTNDRSIVQIAVNTVIDSTVGGTIGAVIPVEFSGITCGRNNMAAVFQSGLTKLGNKTASTMSAKVFGKGIVSGLVSDIGITTSFILKGFVDDAFEDYLISHSIPTDPIYWCVS